MAHCSLICIDQSKRFKPLLRYANLNLARLILNWVLTAKRSDWRLQNFLAVNLQMITMLIGAIC